MKKIYSVLMALVSAAMIFTSCSDKDDFYFTASEDDYPRILNTDIPEGAGGERAALPTITRDNNFKFDIIVTPADYTTVSWFIDGEKVHEGKSIDYSLIAGLYDVDIVATTTKGKETKRMCSLEVLPLEGDPALASDSKSLWCQIGTVKTIDVTNFDGITAAYIAGQKLADFQNNGSSITFTVPEVAEGNQKVVVEAADGMKYGCGDVRISYSEYVDPGVMTVTLWEGSTVINWGDANVLITAEELADVAVGTVIKLHYNVPEAEYHAMRICTPWWGDNDEDNLVCQFDITADTPNPFEFVYDEHCKALVEERGGMLIVGFGYELTKVSYDTVTEEQEQTIWQGSVNINWGDSNVLVSADELAGVAVGKTICLYYDVPEAEYHAMRICTPWWGDNDEDNLVCQFDITADTPTPFEFVYDDHCKALVDERGGMLVVGFGYTLTKITVK